MTVMVLFVLAVLQVAGAAPSATTWHSLYCLSVDLYTLMLHRLGFSFLEDALNFLAAHQDRLQQVWHCRAWILCVGVGMCGCGCGYVCVCVCVCDCVCVCVCVWLYTHTHAHTHARMHAHAHTHAHTHTHTHTHHATCTLSVLLFVIGFFFWRTGQTK